MKIETRVFNKRTKQMIYLPALKACEGGVSADIVGTDAESLLPEDPIMLKTSMQDINKEWLYEGDFVECGIQTSYGLIKDSGVVIWRADIGSFTINIKTPYENQTQFQVVDVIKKGNIYENPELLKNDKTSITKE